MCGRYTLTATPDQLALHFDATLPQDFSPRFNAAPTQQLPVLLNKDPHQFEMLRWGLVPSWSKGIDNKYSMINARSETLTEKPSFKKALEQRRCIVPADSFYEWKKLDDGTKQPMRITLKDEDLFAFAGLWDTWKSPDGGIIRSFTIITTDANDLMRPIHDRMPVILSREAEKRWLDDQTDLSGLTTLLRPFSPEQMRAYPVSKRVNGANIDEPSLIMPVH
ncbi:MAG: SOS response-associated peptidase [Anaerolineae bacterium]|nr:SOS response-associated peptidase [Anaerolineae bacterium]